MRLSGRMSKTILAIVIVCTVTVWVAVRHLVGLSVPDRPLLLLNSAAPWRTCSCVDSCIGLNADLRVIGLPQRTELPFADWNVTPTPVWLSSAGLCRLTLFYKAAEIASEQIVDAEGDKVRASTNLLPADPPKISFRYGWPSRGEGLPTCSVVSAGQVSGTYLLRGCSRPEVFLTVSLSGVAWEGMPLAVATPPESGLFLQPTQHLEAFVLDGTESPSSSQVNQP